MFNSRNIIIIMYLILSCVVIVQLKRLRELEEESVEDTMKSVEEMKNSDSKESKKLKELVNSTGTTSFFTTTKFTPKPVISDDADDRALRGLDWNVWCKLQPNSNDCSGGRGVKRTRFYFDTLLEDCKTFFYSDCKSSYNNFNSLSECHESCIEPGMRPLPKPMNYSSRILCRLQPSFGTGFEYHPSYYYDINKKKCIGFSYSGVGGNGNRFPTNQICSNSCLKLMESEFYY